MQACVLHDIGDIRYEEVKKPEPKAGEVLVKVMACGICGSDIPRVYTTGAHVHPLIIGHEFSGQVDALGEGVDPAWQGRAVGIFPLIPCGECPPCKKKQYEMCRHYSYLGSRCDGGFAEYVAVPAWNLIELPEGVGFEEAAMLEPMAVAVHAMGRAGIHPGRENSVELAGKKVCVYGVGTIGLILTMFLKEAGCEELYVIGNKDFQKRNVLALGVPESNFLDSRGADVTAWIYERTGGAGMDIFFECIGKNDTVSTVVDNTAPAGTVVLVGNPYSDMMLPKAVYWKILRNQLFVTGSWNSSFTHEDTDDWHYVVNRLAEKKIRPAELISHRLALSELERGLLLMRDKTEDYVKIMVVNE